MSTSTSTSTSITSDSSVNMLNSKDLSVIILAAGEGKRMNSDIPKVNHLFRGKPIIVRIILEVMKLYPKQIIIVTGKYNLIIQSTISDYFTKNNIAFSFNKLIFIQQLEPNGTGGAIKSVLNYKSDDFQKLEENVLILNGDMPLVKSDMLYSFLKETLLSQEKIEASLLVSKIDNPFGYGRILYDIYNNFIGIQEEKDCNEEQKKINTVNVGVYFFSYRILQKYISLIKNNNSQKEFYLPDIFKIIKLYGNDMIRIKTHKIEDEYRYQIYGVNTQSELQSLEKLVYVMM